MLVDSTVKLPGGRFPRIVILICIRTDIFESSSTLETEKNAEFHEEGECVFPGFLVQCKTIANTIFCFNKQYCPEEMEQKATHWLFDIPRKLIKKPGK